MMASLDIRTIIFSFVLTNIVSTLVVIFLWKQYHRRYNGISFLILTFAFQTIAFILIALRGIIPFWISLDIANAISVIGILLGYVGLESYVGRKSSQIPDFILLVVFLAVHIWFTFVRPDNTMRYLYISVVSFIFFSRCAWLMLYGAPKSIRQLTDHTGFVFVAFCLVCLAKIIEFFVSDKKPIDYFQSDMFEAYIMIIYQMLIIILTYSLALMFSKHLLLDIKSEEEKFSKAFHTSPYAIVLTRLSDGHIIEANSGFLKNSGYQYQEVLGKSINDLHFWDKEEDREETMEELLKSGKVYEKELQFRNRSGDIIKGLFTSEIIVVNNEECVISSIDDITERKHTEAELIRSKEKAEESDRLKTAFLHNISHEIRTPLNAIIGFSTLLGDSDHNYETRQSFIEVIKNNSDNLLAIVNDIIEVSNIEAGILKLNMGKVNLNVLLNNLYKQFKPKSDEKGIGFNYVSPLPDSDAGIQTDTTKLIQILLNLLRNAIKFTPEGLIEFGYTLKKNYVQFYVSDSGIGIPADRHAKIFDRFYQVDNTITRIYGGTGSGLSISKAFVELIGGKIWLTSEIGKGSVFYFTLPYIPVKPPDADLSKTGENEKIIINGKKSILIAEDDETNYFLMAEFLSPLNVNLIRAHNGKEVVEICESGKVIDLVLMDIKMPVIDGYTAFNKIKNTLPFLPVIATTAYAFGSDMEKILSSGFNDYLSKPFSKSVLLDKVNKFLRG